MRRYSHILMCAFVVIFVFSLISSIHAQSTKQVAPPKVPMLTCSGAIQAVNPTAKTITVNGALCKNKSFTSEVDISGFKVGDRVSVKYRLENKIHIATSISKVESGSQPPIFSCNGNIKAINPTSKNLTVKGMNCDGSFTSEVSIDNFKVNDHVVVKYVQQGDKKIAKSVERWSIKKPTAPILPVKKP
jgi:hypothetical protein